MKRRRSFSQQKTRLAAGNLRTLVILNFVALVAFTSTGFTTLAMLDNQSALTEITQSYGFELRLGGG